MLTRALISPAHEDFSPGDDTLAMRAARYCVAIGQAPLPDHIRQKSIVCVLDILGSCVGAMRSPEASILARYGSPADLSPGSLNIALGKTMSAGDAAFGNAALAHGLIRDDMHVASGSHIGSIVVPAMIALAEREALSGRRFLTGVVAGYELMARLGQAAWSKSTSRHFRPSGISGAFGVAAGGIAALDLDEETGARALGIAANMAAGLNQWAWSAGQEVLVHMGSAARNGIAAIDLAIAGLHPSPDILEGRDGLFAAYQSGSGASHDFAQSLDGTWEIAHVHHKPVAGCNLIQTPIAAAIQLRECEQITASAIVCVTIRTFTQARDYPGCNFGGPFKGLQQSKMSMQFGVALALVYGRVDEAGYADMANPEVLRLMSVTKIVIESDFEGLFPRSQPTAIEILLKDGTMVRHALGDVPWLDHAAVIARFRTEVTDLCGKAAADRLVDIANGLWDEQSIDPLVRCLTRCFERREIG